MEILRYKLFILGWLSFIIATAQEFKPPIQNFSSVDYKGASQNWDIAVDHEGIVYAANHQGLLIFNGLRWEFLQSKDGSIVRSVYPYKGRVYTGSYQEFGYWKRKSNGEMKYTSLSRLFEDQDLGSEEFWEIMAFEGDIYFRSFAAIYKYTGNEIVEVKRVLAHEMSLHQGRILLDIQEKGLHYLEKDGRLVELPGQNQLKGEVITDFEVQDERIYITTRNGFYIYENQVCRRYENQEFNVDLGKFEPNKLVVLGKERVIIGTVKNGLVHLDLGTDEYFVINRRDGLQNNTVLSAVAEEGKVWVGLDNGIDLIHLDSPISFLTDKSGELGSVYDLVEHRDDFFLASNTGVYKILEDNNLSMLPESEGHSWNLEVIEGELYSNHNKGIYKIKENEYSLVNGRTGSFGFQDYHDRKYLVGTYNGIDMYDLKTGSIKTFEKTNFPVKNIIFENSSTFWAAHAYDGLFRIQLRPSMDSVAEIKKVTSPSGIGSFKAHLHRVNNQIAIFLEKKWYRYNVFTDSLEIFQEMNGFSGYRLVSENPQFYWFVQNSSGALVGTDFKSTRISIPHNMLRNRLVKGNEKVIRASDSLFYVTLHDGFAKIDLSKFIKNIEREKNSLAPPTIHEVKDSRVKYSLLEAAEIPYEQAKEISFSIGLPSSTTGTILYELIGQDTIKGSVKDGFLRFQNLSNGNYELLLKNQNSQKDTIGIKTFSFSVLSPWYLTTPFKMIYITFLLGLLGIVYMVNKKKLRKHRILLEEKYHKEHNEKMNRLEKEKLRDEINRKRKELANTTLVAAKKNEVLMEIQGELTKDKHKFTNEYRLKHIMSKINKAIKDKNEWEVFELNFKELHEDFSKDLLHKYPNLSNKDLKLCSYLKMNLSSKEIAPLLGISVRGVEVHRYRLRKKMNLNNSENLTNFLITNF